MYDIGLQTIHAPREHAIQFAVEVTYDNSFKIKPDSFISILFPISAPYSCACKMCGKREKRTVASTGFGSMDLRRRRHFNDKDASIIRVPKFSNIWEIAPKTAFQNMEFKFIVLDSKFS